MTYRPLVLPTETVQLLHSEETNIIQLPIRPQPKSRLAYISMGRNWGNWRYPDSDAWKYWENESYKLSDAVSAEDMKRLWRPPCRADETVLVKETWTRGYIESGDGEGPQEAWFEERLQTGGADYLDEQTRWYYRADLDKSSAKYLGIKWRPATQMPYEAARFFLSIKRVTTEQVKNASGDLAWMWTVYFNRTAKQ